jgi:hypothetical protein
VRGLEGRCRTGKRVIAMIARIGGDEKLGDKKERGLREDL